jgi:hypothetical protein
MNEALLVEQSKGRLNTVIKFLLCSFFLCSDHPCQPLHLAVKCGSIRLVKVLLAYSKSGLLMLDVDGQTPLHNAVSKSFAKITKELLAAVPAEVLHIEDCVGNSPLDIAALLELGDRMRQFRSKTPTYYQEEINPGRHNIAGNPLDIYLDNTDKIVEMLASLEQSQGKYKAEIISVVTKWAAQREAKLPIYREKKRLQDEKNEELKKLEPKPVAVGNLLDEKDNVLHAQQVWKLIYKATTESPAHVPRRLIHLFEVQQSIASTLSKVRGGDGVEAEDDDYNQSYRRRDYRRAKEQDDRGRLDEEESEDKIERRQSMALKFLSIVPDTN